jgi:hypothetical protein
MFENL